MQALSRFQAVSRFETPRARAATIALGALFVAVALAIAARPAAGSYTITLEDKTLTCKSGGELFARFLEDFDGRLPAPWKVAPEASGKSSFTRGALPGFSVELIGKGGEEGGTNPDLGKLCRNP